MILFKPEHVPMILNREKTQTRRFGKKRWRVGAIHQCKTTLFGEPFARVRIDAIRKERLGHISKQDANAEGYPDRASFFRVFEEINGPIHPIQPVWVLTFTLVEVPE